MTSRAMKVGEVGVRMKGKEGGREAEPATMTSRAVCIRATMTNRASESKIENGRGIWWNYFLPLSGALPLPLPLAMSGSGGLKSRISREREAPVAVTGVEGRRGVAPGAPTGSTPAWGWTHRSVQLCVILKIECFHRMRMPLARSAEKRVLGLNAPDPSMYLS